MRWKPPLHRPRPPGPDFARAWRRLWRWRRDAAWVSRALTGAERRLLPSPLREQLDHDRVIVVNRYHSPVAAALNVTVVRGGRIFWSGAPREAVSLAARAHLVHELVHCWQYLTLRKSGLQLLLNRRYRYALREDRSFMSYGYEQQAAIVEDWLRMSEGAPPRWSAAADLNACARMIATLAEPAWNAGGDEPKAEG